MKLHNRQRAHSEGWHDANVELSITENPFVNRILRGDWETGYMDRTGAPHGRYSERTKAFNRFYNEHRELRDKERQWR